MIGAGFAGAATAYHLARSGAGGVLVVEQEPVPGFHASGRNAAMIRQCVPDEALQPLARDGAAFLRALPPDWQVPVGFKRNGSLLLASGDGVERLRRDTEVGRRLGIEVEFWTPEQARRRVPVLEGAEFDGAAWCATDGVVDIHALLTGYLKGAAARGVEIRYGCAVRSIRRAAGGFEVATGEEVVRARTIINAAGAWANAVARMAGAAELPLRACRRHLFVSGPLSWVDSGWPFVWDVSHDFYFRPEGEGLLLCACDQDEFPPGDPPVDPAVGEALAEKIARCVPRLARVSIQRCWAGLRTLSGDGKFVIGWDPRLEGFFWVAGLGGHGVTTSAAVGALAARLVRGGETEPSFSPARFDAWRSGA